MTTPEPSESRFARRRWRSRLRQSLPYLLGLLAAGLVAVAVWVVLASSLLGVHDVRVEGVTSIERATVEEQAAIGAGEPLARLDTGSIADRVEELPRVAEAKVSRVWPRGVRIDVTERVAVALVADLGSGLQGMDIDGVLFRTYRKAPPELPRIHASSVDAERRDEALAEAARVIESLDAAIADRVRRIDVASMDSIELVLGNGDRIRWGSADDSALKAEVLASLLEIPASVYDVTAPGRPTTRS